MFNRNNTPLFACHITGLGFPFSNNGSSRSIFRSLLKQLLLFLYRESLLASEVVFFQNPDDMYEFKVLGLLSNSAKIVRTWGSGVDLKAFPPTPLPSNIRFLMLSRLLVEKGVREYVYAAKIVKARYPHAVFRLAGSFDSNPSGIDIKELTSWTTENHIEYLGELSQVYNELARCRFYVLPSYYREGTPRSVLEAMAVGRPIITTDSPGCRETVVDGSNGFLVQPRNTDDLANAMFRLIEQSEAETQRMAHASIQLARDRYDVHKVNAQILKAMQL